MTFAANAQSPLRIACVGDSITFGDKLENRARDSYPAILERLGEGRFLTGNFGVNGATALDIPYRAWTATRAAQDALAFSPDAVVLLLGINDLAFPEQYVRYPDRLRDIVRSFQSLPSQPRVFLCTLTPIAPAEHQAHANHLIRDTFNPAIRAVAAQTGARLVDLSAAFPNRLDLLPDGLHPSPEGAELIARAVLDALTNALAPSGAIQSVPRTGSPSLSIRNEALAARHRAQRWLQSRPAPEGMAPVELSPDEVEPLLPLLDGLLPESILDPGRAFAELATALDRIGQETVFLAPDRPVAWREALAHQLVQRQRIDSAGGGFWLPTTPTPTPDAIAKSTAFALHALSIALGESVE